MRIRRLLALPLVISLLYACDAGDGAGGPEVGPGAPAAAGTTEEDGSDLLRPVGTEGSRAVRVTFLGTSLTEGLGLENPGDEAWPAQVGLLADSAGIPVEILNAGIGGETSAGALARLDWVLQGDPDVLVVETGANDGLRGLPVEQMENNLAEIVRRAGEADPELSIVIVQMEAPTNMGADYTTDFRAVFPRVASEAGVPLLPFLLGGVGGNPELNQGDGIHPTAEGHRIMARGIWPVLEGVLREAASVPSAR